MKKTVTGFTIVELLIVIVVIAILAAVSIVAYNGIQSRGAVSKTSSELATYKRLLELYKADNGAYPISDSGGTQWSRQTLATKDTFITGLTPTYASSLPIVSSDAAPQYLYLTNAAGSEYKIIKYKSGGLSASEWSAVPDSMKDHRAASADRYGIWSNNGGALG